MNNLDDESQLSILNKPLDPDEYLYSKAQHEKRRNQKLAATKRPSTKSKHKALYWGVAVAVVILLMVGIYWFGFRGFGEDAELLEKQREEKIAALKAQQQRNEEQNQKEWLEFQEKQRQAAEQQAQAQQQLLSKITNAEQARETREQKWEKFYQPRKECVEPSTWDKKVECSNERLKAMQRFDELYRDRKI